MAIFLEENPAISEEIEKNLRDKLLAKPGKKEQAEDSIEDAIGIE